MVINNDPSYAYLLKGNSLVDQKPVMAHVYGHVDFFKNNYWFSKTNRKMIDKMANHAVAHPQLHGSLRPGRRSRSSSTAALSLENLIDPISPFFMPSRRSAREQPRKTTRARRSASRVGRLKTERAYMDQFINPPEFLEEQRKRIEQPSGRAKRNSRRAAERRARSSCSRTRRSSTGSTTCSRSSARRPTTSRRRGRPRS